MKILQPHLGKTALLLISSLSLSYSADTDDPCSLAAAAVDATQGSSIPIKIAHDCLKAIPLHKEDALHTIAQLRLFLQFYSAQAYFANPPTPQLELTPVDLNKTLAEIEANITSGAYTNNYGFDKAIHNIFGLYRDGHVTYESACFMPFLFEHDYPLISVADTPNSMPHIRRLNLLDTGYSVGDKVTKINGIDANEFLIEMANKNSELYWVDPDARFNQLLVGTSNGVIVKGIFTNRNVYDEETDENLTLTWENGTTTEVEWSASLRSAIEPGSWDSAESFYQNICVRSNASIAQVYEESMHPETTNNSAPGQVDVIRNKPRSALPIPLPAPEALQNVRRDEDKVAVAVYGMEFGEVKLFILNDEVGVLQINTFSPMEGQSEDGFIPAFSANITGSIDYLKEKNIKRIIIDVSGNGGGFVRLGRDAVRQFFPGEPTYFASNMRWNPALATMLVDGGNVTNATYWDLGQYKKASDNSDFKDWQEFLGPVSRDDDLFTVIAVDDSKEVEEEDIEPLPVSYSGPQPFADEDIILLSSGMCGSTCAIFSEGFESHGVKTVTLGGRPLAGTMQTVGGIKGSQVLTFDEIAGWAWTFLGDKVTEFDYIPAVFNVNTFKTASINLRNSWRKNDQKVPIEFLYTPSEYRIMYTSEMIINITARWEAAANVVWGSEDDFLKANEVETSSGKQWKSLGQLIWSKINGHDREL